MSQIVYCSQGTTPDEPCMISAFGESGLYLTLITSLHFVIIVAFSCIFNRFFLYIDGGRSMWENAWRIALERLQHQKSPLSSKQLCNTFVLLFRHIHF